MGSVTTFIRNMPASSLQAYFSGLDRWCRSLVGSPVD